MQLEDEREEDTINWCYLRANRDRITVSFCLICACLVAAKAAESFCEFGHESLYSLLTGKHLKAKCKIGCKDFYNIKWKLQICLFCLCHMNNNSQRETLQTKGWLQRNTEWSNSSVAVKDDRCCMCVLRAPWPQDTCWLSDCRRTQGGGKRRCHWKDGGRCIRNSSGFIYSLNLPGNILSVCVCHSTNTQCGNWLL